MIEETGVVVALSGGLADVETRRQGACGSCSANGACGTSLLARYLGRRPLVLRALNRAGAAPGDSVIVGVPEEGLVTASLAAYLVPLLGLMAGGALGQGLGEDLGAGAGGSILGALLGLGLGLGWLSRFNRVHAQDPRYQAVVLRVSCRSSVVSCQSSVVSASAPAPMLQDGSQKARDPSERQRRKLTPDT